MADSDSTETNCDGTETRIPVFADLDPELIVDAVEDAIDAEMTPLCRPLNSYINRVFEMEQLDGTPLIAKFYRPGRWSVEALQEEQDFLLELDEAQLQVVAPLQQSDGATLGTAAGIHFALFPKKGGRTIEEIRPDMWAQIGRLIARMHNVAAEGEATHRTVLDPEESTLAYLDYLLEGEYILPQLEDRFADLVEDTVDAITERFDGVDFFRVHGDCHLSNLIWRPNEGMFLIDFDDLSVGPAVQDFFLLLPGRVQDCPREIDLFLEGYGTFREFDRRDLCLIEALRAMRYVHYIAWCARQSDDGIEVRTADGFGSRAYWEREMTDLEEQLNRIREEER